MVPAFRHTEIAIVMEFIGDLSVHLDSKVLVFFRLLGGAVDGVPGVPTPTEATPEPPPVVDADENPPADVG